MKQIALEFFYFDIIRSFQKKLILKRNDR